MAPLLPLSWLPYRLPSSPQPWLPLDASLEASKASTRYPPVGLAHHSSPAQGLVPASPKKTLSRILFLPELVLYSKETAQRKDQINLQTKILSPCISPVEDKNAERF